MITIKDIAATTPASWGNIAEAIDDNFTEVSSTSSVTIDDALSATSTNPVQNKIVTNKFATKIDTIVMNGSSYTTTNGSVTLPDSGGSSVTIDSTLSTTSTNPVQNKVITTNLNAKVASISIDGVSYTPTNGVVILPSSGGGGGTGTNDYEVLGNKPSINGVTLSGNKTSADLSIPTSTSELTNDSNFVTTTQLDEKVDKVEGKGLSTNDFTTAEKTKLTGIASGADVNVIDTIEVNGTALTISDKSVNITIPTSTSDLTNDSNFVTTTQLDEKVDKVTGKGLSTNDLTDDYKTILDSLRGSNAVTTLTSLPISKRLVIATLSAATDISLASTMVVGQELLVRCTPSADITQPIPTTSGWSSLDGDTITMTSGKVTEISILCVAASTYSISIKSQE